MSDQNKASQTDPPGETPVEPIPPRFWWLKRILTVSGILLAGLVILRLWWGWDVHRRLQSEIDKYVAAGEPIYPEDFNPREPIPDDQNAAKFLRDAEAALNLTPAQTELVRELARDPAGVKAHLDEVGRIVQSNGQVFDLVREARRLVGKPVDWGLRFKSPAISALLPSLSGQRQLSRVLSATAGYQQAIGNHADTIDTVDDLLAQAKTIDANPTLIGHLVAIATNRLVVGWVESFAPELKVSREVDGAGRTSDSASRAQIERLIASLIDETGIHRAHVRALQSERMAQLDIVQMIARGETTIRELVVGPSPGLWDRVGAYLIMPVVERGGIWAMSYFDALSAAVGKPNYAAALSAWPKHPGDWAFVKQLKHPVVTMFLPSLNRAALLHYRILAQRRMAAIALAIRLCEIDHGHRPARLADLVPDYLPEIPLDPFADDGRTVAYTPDASPPVLYSVGRDGVDDEGRFALRSNGNVDYDKLDQVLFLDGDRPRPARDEEEDTPPASPDVQREDRDAEDQDRDGEKK